MDNLYSPLIEVDAKGSLIPGAAKYFEWVGDDAVFTFRDDLRTIDGYPITAQDAAFSLKRIIKLTQNTHGNLKDLLCPNHVIESVSDDCPGIEVKDGKLILKPGGRKPFLFPMLAAIDFAVVPEKSVDLSTLKIKDYRNTSGPFYVSEDAGSGRLTLQANPLHYNFSAKMPQEIKLIPMDKSNPSSSLDALLQGNVDFVTLIDAATPQDVMQFHKEHASQFNLFRTMDFRNILISFTERGRSVFSREQRIHIGRQVRALFKQHIETSLAYKPSEQFFPVFGEGGLSDEQLSQVRTAFSEASEIQFDGKGVTAPIVRLALEKEFQEILSQVLPGITVRAGRNPTFENYAGREKEMPLLFIAGPDTSFMEDIGLISYSMNAGYLYIAKPDQKKWLADYQNIGDKSERIAKLNQLHFHTIKEAIVIPIAVAPYVALISKDWNMGFSPVYAENKLWRISKND